MKKLFIIAITAATIAIAAPVHATDDTGDNATPPTNQHKGIGINKREHRQAKRIEQGVKSGALTKEETKRLVREQARIRKMERNFRSDGKLTPKERFRLQRNLSRASAHIFREKHDRQRRK